MKPFSSFYFIKNNYEKTIRIIIIIGLLALCYLGGVYLDNIKTEAIITAKLQSKFVNVSATYRDEDGAQYNALRKDLDQNDSIEYFNVGMNYVSYKTMLGFMNGNPAYTFTEEDFERFNSYMNYYDHNFEGKDNMILLSKRQAKALKVKPGDIITPDNEFVRTYYGDGNFIVGPLMDVDAFISYFITSEATYFSNL